MWLTLTCGDLACCGQPENGTAARSHDHSGTLHVAFWKLRHLYMLEAEGEDFASGEDRGSAELLFACGSAKRCAGMSASVSVVQKNLQTCTSARHKQKISA